MRAFESKRVCEESTTDMECYKCGGCLAVFNTVCQLHTHMLTHEGGGSYFYNHETREAYPRFNMVCTSTQTELREAENYSSREEFSIKYEHKKKRSRKFSKPRRIQQTDNFKQSDEESDTFSSYEEDVQKPVKPLKVTVKRREKPERKRECKFCNTTFMNKADLSLHVQIGHKDIRFKCITCCESFDTSKMLNKHKSEVHSKGVHKCEVCGKVLCTKVLLEGHMLIHQGKRVKFPCEICEPKKEFTRKSQLKLHMQTHSGETNLQCEFCGKPFRARYLMISHVKHCGGIKPHKCEFCEMRFVSNHILQRHRRTHTGEKPFVCEVCAFASGNPTCLVRHMRTHTGEKPFECSYCLMRFASPGGLTKHIRVHTMEKPYKCEFCSKSFTQKWNLKTHERQHTGETPYQCEVCGMGFKQNVLLKTHIKSHYSTTNTYKLEADKVRNSENDGSGQHEEPKLQPPAPTTQYSQQYDTFHHQEQQPPYQHVPHMHPPRDVPHHIPPHVMGLPPQAHNLTNLP